MELRTTETVAGVTAMETNAGGATVKAALPWVAFEVAVMVTAPTPVPVAIPVLVMEAPVLAVQATAVVISCVVASLKVPITVKACVVPFGIVTEEGETASDINAPVATVRSAVPLMELEVAVIVFWPRTWAVAKPAPLMETPEVEVHETVEVRF